MYSRFSHLVEALAVIAVYLGKMLNLITDQISESLIVRSVVDDATSWRLPQCVENLKLDDCLRKNG